MSSYRIMLNVLVSVTIATATPSFVNGQAADPDRGSLALQVADVINQKSADVRIRFIARHLAPAARADSARMLELLTTLHTKGAPFELFQREEFGPHSIIKLRSARAARVITLHLAHTESRPDSLELLDILATYAAVYDSLTWPKGRVEKTSELVTLIRDNLARLDRAGAFSGVVHILKGDSVLLSYSAGMANREYDISNGLHTRFALASIGKMFTATAIMQLVQVGKLRLDDKVADVLPAYPNPERAARITIRQLLEHTAGLGDQWSTPAKPVAGLKGQLAVAGAIAYAPFRFEPGSRWSYSNEGYTLLGAIIEHVSGETFAAYLQNHIFGPAGMTETVIAGGRDDHVPQRAVGYRPAVDDVLGTGAPRANWSFLSDDGASGAGGEYSTAPDLARFGAALRKGVLLDPVLRDSMWIGRWQIGGHAGSYYGWGAFVEAKDTRIAVGHGGGGTGSGMDSGFRMFTDGSYTVVVLTNFDPPMGNNLTGVLVDVLARQ